MYKESYAQSSGEQNYTVISKGVFGVLLCGNGAFKVLYVCSSLTNTDLGHNYGVVALYKLHHLQAKY